MKDVKKGAKLADLDDDVRHGPGNVADKAHADVNRLARDLERRMQKDERRTASQHQKSK